MTKIVRMSPEKQREAFGFALKAAIERNDRTAVEIADFAGVTQGTVDEWRAGRKLPHEATLLSLIAFMGPAFGSDLFAPHGLAMVDCEHGAATGVAQQRRTQTKLAETLTELCRAMEDGYVDHREGARLWRLIVPLLPELMAYAPREPVSDAGHGGSDARADVRVVGGRFER